MNLNSGIYSSNSLMEEIKWRIKNKYGSQERFAKEFGATRKTLNRLINHNGDFESIVRMCKLLDISGIQIE
jgi:predicted XRE-type DNA-binding protein